MQRLFYIFGDSEYSVTDTTKVHTRLQSDPDFLSEYLQSGIFAPELVSISAETTNSRCIASEMPSENFMWTKEATRLLVTAFLDRKKQFKNPKIKKKTLWTEILHIMNAKGYTHLNTDLLDRKMRNMKKSYKNIKTNKTNTERRRETSWEYFDAFEEIYGNDLTINCGPTLSSMQSDEEMSLSVQNATMQSESVLDDSEVTSITHILSDFCSNQISTPLYTSDTSSSISPFQPILHSPGSSMTSSVPSMTPPVNLKSERSEKSVQMSSLYNMRKKQLHIEQQRVNAIIELTGELKSFNRNLDRSNKIQEERNNFLHQLLLSRSDRSGEGNRNVSS